MTHDLNLLPADFIERVKWRKAATIWIGIVVSGVVIVFSIFNLSKSKIVSVKQDIAHLQQQDKALQPIIETLHRLEQKREALHRIEAGYQAITKNQGISQISGILSRVIPPRVRVTFLKINDSDQLSLKGRADSNADVAIFLRHLNQYAAFSNATLRYANREQNLEQAYILFEITKDAAKIAQK